MMVPAWRAAADRLDCVFDFDGAGLFKHQRAHRPWLLILHQWLLELHEHQMERTRLELDSFTRLDLDAFGQVAHLHHAAYRAHLMDFETAGEACRTADQPVRRGAIVGDLEVATGDGRAFRCRSRPGMTD